VHGGSASPIREEAGREGLGVQPSDELSAEPRKARARPRACARAREHCPETAPGCAD